MDKEAFLEPQLLGIDQSQIVCVSGDDQDRPDRQSPDTRQAQP